MTMAMMPPSSKTRIKRFPCVCWHMYYQSVVVSLFTLGKSSSDLHSIHHKEEVKEVKEG